MTNTYECIINTQNSILCYQEPMTEIEPGHKWQYSYIYKNTTPLIDTLFCHIEELHNDARFFIAEGPALTTQLNEGDIFIVTYTRNNGGGGGNFTLGDDKPSGITLTFDPDELLKDLIAMPA